MPWEAEKARRPRASSRPSPTTRTMRTGDGILSSVRLCRPGDKRLRRNTWRRNGLAWGDREMRKLLGVFVPLLAFVLIAAAADVTGKGVATSAALQRLEVAHSQDGLRVEFKAKGTLAPKVTTLDSPARIVVDFPNTVMATAQSRISVGSDGVKDLR